MCLERTKLQINQLKETTVSVCALRGSYTGLSALLAALGGGLTDGFLGALLGRWLSNFRHGLSLFQRIEEVTCKRRHSSIYTIPMQMK